ncbi:50S ribosomal protein L5 [Candidatus Gracilibacteria bacterium]|nr:50S ribosomal protein L5 [Candidatus Gracilibacteria bacterium]
MKIKSKLYERYQKEIKASLQKELGIKNPMQVPKVQKVSINIGMGSYLQKLGSKDFSFVEKNLELISGQKPVVRNAKKAISNFKLREGNPVGISVTLRGQEAYNFIDKLIHVVYPRVRDFRGVRRNVFDKDGNCSLGFTDHTVFPEGTNPEDSRKIHGIEVTIVTSTKNSDHSRALLESFGFPFNKQTAEVANSSTSKK